MARNVWSDRPLGVELAALVGVGTVSPGVFAAISVQGAVSEIPSIIGPINASQSTIAAAVEEQTTTTTEMNRNVSESVQSADQVAEGTEAVAADTASTTRAIGDAQAAIDAVARMATTLQGSVAKFRY
jgi:methyl-accepting chemotaxis protein